MSERGEPTCNDKHGFENCHLTVANKSNYGAKHSI